ncbi:MAG TPA: amino acid ABC transporter ATP-binding protein [Erysipelothrix sp.]|nr:amino acid ABC transporter ATP-binding protein [Erysipelothrix sp.]
MIKVKNLDKSYSNVQVLKDVSVEFKKKQISSIIGPSGTGKSTLLRCILGLESFENGSITVNDKQLEFETNKLLDYRQELGVVFQDFHLFKHMTVLKNITYSLEKVKNLKEKEASDLAHVLLEQFSLLDQTDKYPSQLSGGQRQRVAIARSLALNPSFLLLDEPTSALDADTVLEFVLLLREIKKTTGIIIITHDLNFAKRVSDEIYLMDQGQIVEHQSTEQFFDSPITEIAKRYIESQIV